MAAGGGNYSIVVDLPNEVATAQLAAVVAPLLRQGDTVTLAGPLGSGKTTFARYLIRLLARDGALEIPSPTFTLIQTYETFSGPVVHGDLYRIGDAAELAEIPWDEAGADPIVLVEWPERAGSELPEERLAITFAASMEQPETRTVTLEGKGRWAARLERGLDTGRFLHEAGWGAAERVHIQGDASTRRYERLIAADGRTAILMDAPKQADGPPVRDGQPYSRLAHLAEDVKPFVAMARGLKARDISVPAILAEDLGRGFLLLEDLGLEPLYRDGLPDSERVSAATDLLMRLHSHVLPSELPIDAEHVHRIPVFDRPSLMIELELLLDWHIPYLAANPDAQVRHRFLELWGEALAPVLEERTSWSLRDYHSPNLLWLPERAGTARVGVLDFQDAVLGHPAYDLVSLLQDARLDVPESLELTLISRYVGGRRMSDIDFDPIMFARCYATLGAQRATKILGIFVRLLVRDGKPGYLRHIPRLRAYLDRDLAHPALKDLRHWYAEHLPLWPAEGRVGGAA